MPPLAPSAGPFEQHLQHFPSPHDCHCRRLITSIFFLEQNKHQPFLTRPVLETENFSYIYEFHFCFLIFKHALTFFLLNFTESLSRSLTLNSENCAFTLRICRVELGFLMTISNISFCHLTFLEVLCIAFSKSWLNVRYGLKHSCGCFFFIFMKKIVICFCKTKKKSMKIHCTMLWEKLVNYVQI